MLYLNMIYLFTVSHCCKLLNSAVSCVTLEVVASGNNGKGSKREFYFPADRNRNLMYILYLTGNPSKVSQ